MSGGVLGRGSSRYDSWFMNILCISIFAGPGNFLAHHCSAGQRQLWRVSSHDDGAGIQLSSRPRLLKSWRLSLVGCGNIYIKSFQILVLYSIDIWSLTPQAWVPSLGTHCGLVWSELCTQAWYPGLGGQRPDIDTVCRDSPSITHTVTDNNH